MSLCVLLVEDDRELRSTLRDDVYLTLEQPLPGEDGVAAAARPGGILVPKIARSGDIKTLEERLRMLKADPGIVLWAMIEPAAWRRLCSVT